MARIVAWRAALHHHHWCLHFHQAKARAELISLPAGDITQLTQPVAPHVEHMSVDAVAGQAAERSRCNNTSYASKLGA